MSMCITGDVNFGHIPKMGSANILQCKLTISSFIITKHLGAIL